MATRALRGLIAIDKGKSGIRGAWVRTPPALCFTLNFLFALSPSAFFFSSNLTFVFNLIFLVASLALLTFLFPNLWWEFLGLPQSSLCLLEPPPLPPHPHLALWAPHWFYESRGRSAVYWRLREGKSTLGLGRGWRFPPWGFPVIAEGADSFLAPVCRIPIRKPCAAVGV